MEQNNKNKKKGFDILEKYNVTSYETLLEKLSSADEKEILEIYESTDSLMENMCKSIKYTQLRTIHSELMSGVEILIDLSRLMPKLAYFQARQENGKAKKFVEFIRLLAKQVILSNDNSNIKRFKDFMDSIVAYHKLNCN